MPIATRAGVGIAVGLLLLGTMVPLRPQAPQSSPSGPQPDREQARRIAWQLALDAIQPAESIVGGGKRTGIPRFVSWRIARDIFPCSHTPPVPNPSLVLFDETFHFDPTAAARLCGPLTEAGDSPPVDRALAYWMKLQPRPDSVRPFPDGSTIGAAFWNPVRALADGSISKLITMQQRRGDQVVEQPIRLVGPATTSGKTPENTGGQGDGNCPATRRDRGVSASPSTGTRTESIDRFFWLRLEPGEQYNGARCGDFAVLMAFHLVHKVQGRWLWSTFWWDPDSREFGAGRPATFSGSGSGSGSSLNSGSGPNPDVWANYSMDATFEPEGVMFNPWRIEEREDNCARCHAEIAVYQDPTGSTLTFDAITALRTHFQ